MEILIRVLIRTIILSPIGRLYLWVKYRDRKQIKIILKNEYGNRYSDAGIMMFSEAFGIVFLFSIAMLVIGCIISIFKFGIGN